MGALLKIQQAGFEVSLTDAGGLAIAPASLLNDSQREFLKQHKAEIVDELRAELMQAHNDVAGNIPPLAVIQNYAPKLSNADPENRATHVVTKNGNQAGNHEIAEKKLVTTEQSKAEIPAELIQAQSINNASDQFDDRHYCRECQCLINGRCITQRFRPVDDMPRRCEHFNNKYSEGA
ncbi:MAG: hypothetical protein ACXV8P_02520 [Methylobacter sp.]